jgi:hypothetical protein
MNVCSGETNVAITGQFHAHGLFWNLTQVSMHMGMFWDGAWLQQGNGTTARELPSECLFNFDVAWYSKCNRQNPQGCRDCLRGSAASFFFHPKTFCAAWHRRRNPSPRRAGVRARLLRLPLVPKGRGLLHQLERLGLGPNWRQHRVRRCHGMPLMF